MVLHLCAWQGENSGENLEDFGIPERCLPALVLRYCLKVLNETLAYVSCQLK